MACERGDVVTPKSQEEKDMTEGTTRMTFKTEAEAAAFIEGVEFCDNDHVSTEGPSPELDKDGAEEYAVYVTEFC